MPSLHFLRRLYVLHPLPVCLLNSLLNVAWSLISVWQSYQFCFIFNEAWPLCFLCCWPPLNVPLKAPLFFSLPPPVAVPCRPVEFHFQEARLLWFLCGAGGLPLPHSGATVMFRFSTPIPLLIRLYVKDWESGRPRWRAVLMRTVNCSTTSMLPQTSTYLQAASRWPGKSDGINFLKTNWIKWFTKD